MDTVLEKTETIFDFNPTDAELKRFGLDYSDKNYLIESPDTCNYQLGILFTIRNNNKMAEFYFNKIKNRKWLSGLFMQDF